MAELFNLAITAKAIGTTSNNSGILSYTVDLEGYIEFPVLGAINVNGKTRKEIASLIKEELISRELLKDPVVTVEFANLCISVLGEVKTPGRYSIDGTRSHCLMHRYGRRLDHLWQTGQSICITREWRHTVFL